MLASTDSGLVQGPYLQRVRPTSHGSKPAAFAEGARRISHNLSLAGART